MVVFPNSKPSYTDRHRQSVSVSVCVENAFRSVKSVKLPTLPTSLRSKKISSDFLRNRPMPTPTSSITHMFIKLDIMEEEGFGLIK
jgi:hypothetical protein